MYSTRSVREKGSGAHWSLRCEKRERRAVDIAVDGECPDWAGNIRRAKLNEASEAKAKGLSIFPSSNYVYERSRSTGGVQYLRMEPVEGGVRRSWRWNCRWRWRWRPEKAVLDESCHCQG